MATLKVTNIKNESFAGDQLYLKTDGKIGIGTTSPQRHLVLYESASGQTQIQFQNSTTGTATTDGFSVGLDSSEKGFIWNYEGTDTYIGGEGGTSITIKNDGKIGIGTTSPNAKLTVNGDLFFGGTGSVEAGSSTGSLTLVGGSTYKGGRIVLRGGSSDSDIKFTTSGASITNTERMCIRSDGKLQIGTAGGNATYLALAGNAAMDLWGDGSEYPTLRLGTEVYNSVGEDIRFGRSDHGAADIRYHSLKSLHGSSAANNYLEFFLHDFGSSPYTSQKSAFKINGLGNAIIPDGDLVIGTAGHGIDFSATANGTGSAQNELFDDYEEGTWTPAYDTSGSTGAISNVTYATQVGRYVKIGRVVYLEGVLKTSAITVDTSGTYDIGGMPFTAATGTAIGSVFTYLQNSWNNAPRSFDAVAGTTRMRGRQGIDVGDGTYTTGNTNDFQTNAGDKNRIYFSGQYKV